MNRQVLKVFNIAALIFCCSIGQVNAESQNQVITVSTDDERPHAHHQAEQQEAKGTDSDRNGPILLVPVVLAALALVAVSRRSES